MSPNLSIDRGAVSAFCRRHHITRLALFGSALRGDFGPDSDVDVLVEFAPGHVPGLSFVSIEREFSELLQGRRIDMVTAKFLNPRIRRQVLEDAESLYVAACPEIPWSDIIGMRHKVVHDYLGVDEDIVWQVVREDLPSPRRRSSVARHIGPL